ncbi:MAG: reverse transcriptase domain-containing protein [Hyphomonadaceae bacterium]|nr:reverse transcriptase domain-containing protein [Hyphomonadaceae bacterium]
MPDPAGERSDRQRPAAFGDAPMATIADVAAFLGSTPGNLTWTLYKAPDSVRYRAFEIPKRSGGMRQIHAPIGLVRDWQSKLAPILQAAYEAHPAAHGFLPARGVMTNARLHVGQRLVLNIDLEDFFPSVNFGRVRGLFMKPPFCCAPAAATVLAQICTHRNGLPQGAPTSPALSNFAAAALDRRLTRLAKDNNLRYSRYADDITFSTNQPVFPPAVAEMRIDDGASLRVRAGEALERAVAAAGFSINHKKVRLQKRGQRQSVTGIVVNERANITRTRVRKVRAMLHAWKKHGLEAAGWEHFNRYRGSQPDKRATSVGRAFRHMIYGELSFLKMVRGRDDAVLLKLCAQVLELDPNPSKFIRQMAFGADDYDVFISHASEDKETVARPIFEACARAGLKAFLDEAHIGWGQSFTAKINTALGSARTVLAIVSSNSVNKEWPVLEVNTALALETNGFKKVVPLFVGNPDLSRLPLLRAKDAMVWKGDPEDVAKRLRAAVSGDAPRRPAAPAGPRLSPGVTAVPVTGVAPPGVALREAPAPIPPPRRRTLWEWIFGRRGPPRR